MKHNFRFCLWTALLGVVPAGFHAQAATETAGDATVIFDMDTVKHHPGEATNKGAWAWDKTHLGAKGHALTATTVLQAVESAP